MNNNNDLKVRHLKIEDLEQVAVVHRRAYKDSALTKLGQESVRRYYEWCLTGPHECYAIGVFDTEQTLLGFCFAGIFWGALSGFLQRNKKFLILSMLMRPWLIANPIVLDRVKLAILSLKHKLPQRKSHISRAERLFGILSIAVDPKIQGVGIGKILMDAVEMHAKNRGSTLIDLVVHPSNVVAVAFYERCGWKKENDDSGIWTGVMTKSLNNLYVVRKNIPFK